RTSPSHARSRRSKRPRRRRRPFLSRRRSRHAARPLSKCRTQKLKRRQNRVEWVAEGAGGSALFLKVVNSGVPGRRPCCSFRRAGHRAACLRRSDWEITQFHALRRSPRAGRASRGAAPWKGGLIVSTLRFIDPWRGGLTRAQSRRATLLNCPRIAPYRGKICSHGRRLL